MNRQVSTHQDTQTGRPEPNEGLNGDMNVSLSGAPGIVTTPLMYTNGGGTSSTTTTVAINSGASAGSQHLQASGDAEADVLQELVQFTFTEAQAVKRVKLSLSVVPLTTTEVQALKFIVNGDIVADATALFNESGISWMLQNTTEVIKSGVNITSISCIATASGVASSVATGALIHCVGYSA